MIKYAVLASLVSLSVTEAGIQPVPTGQGSTISSTTIAAAGGVTNFSGWLLMTNGFAYANGKSFDFSSSTSAGLLEVQANNSYNPTNFNGSIVYLQPGTHRFTAPFVLTNNLTIIGDGYWSTVLQYAGPTNVLTVSNVMNYAQRNQSRDFYFTNLYRACLIGLSSPSNSAQCFHFSGFAVQSLSNFPCVLVGGHVSQLYQDHMGFFGPAVGIATNSFFSSMQWQGSVQPSYVVGELVSCGNNLTLEDSWLWDLADGVGSMWNAFFTVERTGFGVIGMTNTGALLSTNQYPNTNWLSLGTAIYVGNGNLSCKFLNNNHELSKLDMWIDDTSASVDYPSFQGSAANVGVSYNTVSDLHNLPVNASLVGVEDPGVGLVATFYTTNLISYSAEVGQLESGLVSTVVGGQYAFAHYLNGQFEWGFSDQDPSGAIFVHQPGFYITNTMPITANGSGLTNLSMSPNLIPKGINGFEVVVTNTTGPHGYTNFYGSGVITNRTVW